MTKVTVACPYPVERLARVAKRMARKSAIRLSEPHVAKRIRVLHRLVRADRRCKLAQGDVLVELIDKYGLRPVDLARELKERANHLSEMYHVARMFPRRVREPHVPYSIFWAAMRTVRKFKQLKLDPVETLREIASNGFTQHRQVSAHFAAKLRKQESDEALARVATRPAAGWVNRCHHADFRSMLDVIPPRSAKILHVDPPYASFRRLQQRRYASGSATSTVCDNETAAEAIQLTVDLLRVWRPKLAGGGALLLWQASGPLPKQINEAIDGHEWEVESVVVWDKGAPQPGRFESPYSPQSEWLWVLRRAGDRLVNHDGSPRGDVLRFSPVHRLKAAAHNRDHFFEKPLDLCRFLVGKHSYPGELVLDFCGCTGAMALAASEMGRRWVYVESNAANFRLGASRMSQTPLISRKRAG